MNKRLAEFLIVLVRDPARLGAFNDTESGREALLRDADLPEEDKAALRSDDATDVLRRLQSDDDALTWVIAPGIKKFTVGYTVGSGIKASEPAAARRRAMATEGAGIKSMAMATEGAGIKAAAMATEGAGIKAMATEGAGIKDTAETLARGAARKKTGTRAAKPASKKSASKKSASRKSSKSRR